MLFKFRQGLNIRFVPLNLNVGRSLDIKEGGRIGDVQAHLYVWK
jgi:hypothetical protein